MTSGLTPAGESPRVMAENAIAPLLGLPVEEVLATLGLPPLPTPDQAAPAPPGMPTLPPLDLAALFKPLTDMLAGFGSGDLSQAALNPTQVFQGVQQTLQSTQQMSTSAMSALSPMWTGTGADAAIASGRAGQTDGAAVGAQSAAISASMTAASASVAKGRGLLEGVIASLSAVVTAAAPFMLTPPGQAAILSAASTHVAQGTAIVAETRTEMTGHTAAMTTAGMPISITQAPQILGQLTQLGSTILGTVMKQRQTLGGGVPSLSGGAEGAGDRNGEVGMPVAMRMFGGLSGGAMSGGSISAAPGARTDAMTVDSRPQSPIVDPLRAAVADSNASSARTTFGTPTAAPMAGTGGFHGAVVSKTMDSDRPYASTGGEDVAGALPVVSPTVMGNESRSGPLNLAVESSGRGPSEKSARHNSLDL